MDYNNHYSLRRALTTLEREFNLALNKQNMNYAKEVINAARLLYDKLERGFRESEDYGETMSYNQKVFAQKMRNFIAYLTKKVRLESGLSDKYQRDIEKIIDK